MMRAIVAVALALAVSGCLAQDPDEPEDDPANQHIVLVTDPDGNPLPGVHILPADVYTDSNGTAEVSASTHSTAALDGFTTECFGHTDSVMLYPVFSQGAFADTITGPGQVGFQNAQWFPHEMPWMDHPEWLFRLVELRLELTWTNDQNGGADLGIALGDDSGFRYQNQEFQTNVGTFTEVWTPTGDEVRAQTLLGPLMVGPSVSTLNAAPNGLAYDLTWQATVQRIC